MRILGRKFYTYKSKNRRKNMPDSAFPRTLVHTSINFGKIKFITYIYIIFLTYLGENTLQAALRAGGLYLDSLRAATSSQQ